MKLYSKVLSVALLLIGFPVFATEAPKQTFSIWGDIQPADKPLAFYDLIRGSQGQEITGVTARCFDGGSGLSDQFVFRAQVRDARTGAHKYDFSMSIDCQNFQEGAEDCQLLVGQGVAVSGSKRAIIVGLYAYPSDPSIYTAVVKSWNVENGVVNFTKSFPIKDGDFYLDTQGSLVGNFVSNQRDQLKVGYLRYNSDYSTDMKVTYYDVVSGEQVGQTISYTLPPPEQPTP